MKLNKKELIRKKNQGSQEIIRNLNDSLTGEVAFKRVTKVYKGYIGGIMMNMLNCKTNKSNREETRS